jgi:hypothetical protein
LNCKNLKLLSSSYNHHPRKSSAALASSCWRYDGLEAYKKDLDTSKLFLADRRGAREEELISHQVRRERLFPQQPFEKQLSLY